MIENSINFSSEGGDSFGGGGGGISNFSRPLYQSLHGVHGHMKWTMFSFLAWYSGTVETLDLLELLLWPHEVGPWFYSWYRGRVEILDAKYTLIFR